MRPTTEAIMASNQKTIEELQRELLERQLAEQSRKDAERIREIQARCRRETERLARTYGRVS
jgi:hypothetical protein